MDLPVSVLQLIYLLFKEDICFINPIFENIYKSLI